MVYKVVSVYHGNQEEVQVADVADVRVGHNMVVFVGAAEELLAGFAIDGLLYYQRISLG